MKLVLLNRQLIKLLIRDDNHFLVHVPDGGAIPSLQKSMVGCFADALLGGFRYGAIDMVHFKVRQPDPNTWVVEVVPTAGAMSVPTRYLDAGAPVCACRWSPDGTMLAVGLDDDRLLVLPADWLNRGSPSTTLTSAWRVANQAGRPKGICTRSRRPSASSSW